MCESFQLGFIAGLREGMGSMKGVDPGIVLGLVGVRSPYFLYLSI